MTSQNHNSRNHNRLGSEARRSIPPPAQVADAYARIAPSPDSAIWLAIAGYGTLAERARAVGFTKYRDAMCLVADVVERALNAPSRLQDRAVSALRELDDAISRGDLSEHETAAATTALWAAIASLGDDSALADAVALARERFRPAAFFTLHGPPRPPAMPAEILGAISGQTHALNATTDPTARGVLLLRIHGLASAANMPETRRIRTLIEHAGDGAGGAVFPLMLHRLDMACLNPDTPESQRAAPYLDALSARCQTPAERAMVQWRRSIITGSDRLSGAELAAASNDIRYLTALGRDDFDVAAACALDAARESVDTALAAAWNVRALHLLRAADASPQRISHAARLLQSRADLHGRTLRAVSLHGAETLVGCFLSQGRIDEAAETLELLDCPDEISALRVFLLMRAGRPTKEVIRACLRWPHLDALLGPLLATLPPDAAVIDDIQETIACSTPQRAELLGAVLMHTLLYQLGDAGSAFDAAHASDDASLHLGILWARWASAYHRGALEHFVALMPAPPADSTSERTSAFSDHRHAARAEAGIASDVAIDVAAEICQISDAAWREVISTRAGDSELERRRSGAWNAIHDASGAFEARPGILDEVARGRALLAAGHWVEATELFTALADGSRRPDDHYRLLKLAARTAALIDDRGAQAIPLFERLLSLAPHQPEPWDEICRHLLAVDRVSALAATLDKHAPPRGAATHVREAIEAHFLAQIDAHEADISSTVRALAATLEVTDGGALSRWITQAVSAGKVRQMHTGLVHAHGVCDDENVASMLKHALHRIRDEFAIAVDTTDLVSQIRRTGYPPSLMQQLDEHLRARKDLDALATLLDRLEREAPDDAKWVAQSLAAAAYRDAGRLDEAEIRAKRIIERDPRHQVALEILHRAASQRGDWERAVALMEAAARQERDTPKRAQLYREIGRVFETELHLRNAALENYLVSFICESDDPTTLERLEALYSAMGRYKELGGAYEIAIDHARSIPNGRLNAVDLLMRKAQVEFEHLGRHERAAASLMAALRLDPVNVEIVDILVDVVAPFVDIATVRDAVALHLEALDASAREARSADPRLMLFLP